MIFNQESASDTQKFLASPKRRILEQKSGAKIFEAKLPKVVIRGTPGRICHIQGKGPIIICSDHGILVENYICPSDSYLELDQGTFI